MNSRIKLDENRIEIINNILKEIADAIILHKPKSIGLLGGDLGLILYLYEYMHYLKWEELGEVISNRLSESLDIAKRSVPTFCSGLAGLGWLLQYFSNESLLETDLDFIMSNVDEILEKWMIKEILSGNYDFLHGSMGVAFYFQTRKNEKTIQCIKIFLEILESMAEEDVNQTVKWLSFVQKNSKLVYNLSLSHGMASIISFLTTLCEKNILYDKSLNILYKVVGYIKNNRNPVEFTSSFSSTLDIGQTEYNESRLAWCYGDLGIASVLYRASHVLSDNGLEQLSINVLKKATQRKDVVKEIVNDACFCHGSSGIMHIYNRMYQVTSDEVFNEAARYWLDVTIAKANEGMGVAGYQFYNPVDKNWCDEYSILNGVAGIGLGLLAMVSDKEPSWDECLLLS